MDNSRQFQRVIVEFARAIKYIVDMSIKKTTQNYLGQVLEQNIDGSYNIKLNGKVHAIKMYGNGKPNIGDMVQVFIPQGNMNLAWFFVV